MLTYNYSNELYHHGIKGQKWGVRRYQNKDGSLTAAGKRNKKKERTKYEVNRYNQINKDYREAYRIGAENAYETDIFEKDTGFYRHEYISDYTKAKHIFNKYGVQNIEGLEKLKNESYTDAVKKYNDKIERGGIFIGVALATIGASLVGIYETR